MNKIFKTVWNRVRRCYVAVNEAVCGASQASGSSSAKKGVLITAAAVMLTSGVAVADTNMRGWSFYTGRNDWSNDINSRIYGNDSTDVTMTGNRTYDFLAIGRRSGDHIYPSAVEPYEGSLTGVRPLPFSGLTAGSNLTIAANSSVTVNNNMWLFGTWFVTRGADDIGNGRDDLGGFGQDIYMKENSRLTVRGVLDVGVINDPTYDTYGGHPSLYWDWNEIQLSPGSVITAGNIDGAAKWTVNNATVISGGILGTGWEQLWSSGHTLQRAEYDTGWWTITGNQAYVQAHTLDSNSTIFLSNGATLAVDVVNLTKQTVNGTDSTFKTSLGAVGSLTTTTKKVPSLTMAGAASNSLNGASLGTMQAFGGFNQNFTNNVKFSNGTFYFTGTYSESVANAVQSAVDAAFGSSNNAKFDAIVADVAELGNGLTTAQVNSVLAENGNPERILHTTVWDQQNQNNTVTTSSSNTAIGVSIGFKGLKNDVSTTVTNGKTLVLLGDGTASAVANGVLIADGGLLQLGVNGVTSGGAVKDIDLANNGTVSVASGAFTFGSISGKGNVNVAQRGTANLTNHMVDGVFANAGTLNITGALSFADNSSLTSSGLINTIQDNVFQNVTPSVIDPLNVINLKAQLPEEIRAVADDLFRKYVPGEVADALAEHASFTGGKVVVTGVNLTNTQVADLTQAFKEKLFSPDSSLDSNVFPMGLV